MSDALETKSPYSEVILLLKEGVETTAPSLEQDPALSALSAEWRGSLPLLTQVQQWTESLPPERLRETLLAVLLSLDRLLRKAVQEGRLDPARYGADAENPTAPFLVNVLRQIGPEVRISANRMIAALSLSEDFAPLWTDEMLEAGLQRQGIVFGIQKPALRLARQKPGKTFKAAIGKEPVAGKDAVLEDCLGLACLDGSPMILADGRTDLKRLSLFCDVTQGQVLLKKIPATPGEPGTNVLGESLPARDGVDVAFPTVENTQISEDGLALVSGVDGCAYWEGERLLVVPALIVKGNVDFTTGNINVDVTVTVEKDVLSDFRVESTKDIVVKGTVEGARLDAEGTIVLMGGVQGRERARITAKKDVVAHYIDLATVEAANAIRVEGSVVHSHLRCGRLEVFGSPAEVVGGIVEAGTDACANQFGSEVGVKTEIFLGKDIDDLAEGIRRIEEEIPLWREKLGKFTASRQSLEKARQDKGSLSEDQEKLCTRIGIGLQKTQDKIAVLLETLDQKNDLLDRARQTVRTVRARQNIYPGVEIHILGHTQTFKIPTGPATVTLVNDTIEVVPFRDRDFKEEEEVE